jgi:sec-independent protein translocase protein TatA
MFAGLFQPMHLLVIMIIAMLVFGPKKLPELGKGLGDGLRGFRNALKGEPAPASSDTSVVDTARGAQGTAHDSSLR